jgi:hypothetical protein
MMGFFFYQLCFYAVLSFILACRVPIIMTGEHFSDKVADKLVTER